MKQNTIMVSQIKSFAPYDLRQNSVDRLMPFVLALKMVASTNKMCLLLTWGWYPILHISLIDFKIISDHFKIINNHFIIINVYSASLTKWSHHKMRSRRSHFRLCEQLIIRHKFSITTV